MIETSDPRRPASTQTYTRMNNLLTILSFESKGIRTIILRDGEPLFVATDVATALSYGSGRSSCAQSAIKRHFGNLKLFGDLIGPIDRILPNIGQMMPQSHTKLLSESEVCYLIVAAKQSVKRVIAKRFQSWFLNYAIPQIRKTVVTYAVPRKPTPSDESSVAIPNADLCAMRDMIERLEKRVAILESASNQPISLASSAPIAAPAPASEADIDAIIARLERKN